MSQIVILGPAGPTVRGAVSERSAPQRRSPSNNGQGDARKRIVPVVKPPAGPSAEAWEGGVYLSLAQWLEAKRSGAGVLLQPMDDPVALTGTLDGVGLVAVDFHRINDGRGYSLAYLLRDRIGYKGPLRAVGAITADQMHALARAGFDQFALRADQEAMAALAALKSFTFSYQAGLAAGSQTLRRAAAARAEALIAHLRASTPVVAAAS